ncbi:MAG: hypothetical protein HWD83_06950 [Gammaproteobacteria bacterium]|nr:hypothetical protein [Gammaproteobacteria bacterium]
MLRKVLATATAVASLTPQLSHALGLGQVTLKSALNEPLEAEIRLVDADDLQSGDFVVRLASERAFNLSQIPRDPFLTRLNFEIDEERGVVIVTSQAPVREPYLSLLVEASWSSGRVLREYTLLLDLPSLSDETVSAPVQTARTAPVAETVVSTPQQDPVTIPASRPNVAERETRATEQAQSNGEYFVRSGDTLWSIAKALRPASDVTIQQMILALRAANPDAFLNGDINRLMRGSTLSVPSADDARAYNQFEARDAVANGISSTGSLSSLGTEGTLVVSSGDDVSGTVELEEAVDGLKNENDQLRTRIDELETENETMGELIELRSEELSRLQDSVTTETENSPAEAEVADTIATPDPDPSASSSSEESTGANEMEASVDDINTTTTSNETEAAPAEAAPVRPRGPVVAQTNSVTPWYLEPIYQAAAAGIALLGLLFFWWRRRQQKDDENEQLNQAFAPVSDSEKIGAGSSSVADILADARREDFDDGDVDLDIDEAELESTMVDYLESEDNSFDEELNLESPVAAADGYIAFDQFDKARHILEQALERDETDDQARLKLLEVLAAQKDVQAFNTQADYFNLSDDSAIEAQIDALRSALPTEEMNEPSVEDVDDAEVSDDDFASVDLDNFDIETTPVSTAFGESDDNDETSFEDFDLSEFEVSNNDSGESTSEVTEIELSESDDLNDFDLDDAEDSELALESLDSEAIELESDDEPAELLEDDETLVPEDPSSDDVVLTEDDLSLDVNALIGGDADNSVTDDEAPSEMSSLDDETLEHIHTNSPEFDDFDFDAELDNAVQPEHSEASLDEASDDSTLDELELVDSESDLSVGSLQSDTVELVDDAETEEDDRFEVDFSLDDATVIEPMSAEETDQELSSEASDDELTIEFSADELSLAGDDEPLEIADSELANVEDEALTLEPASVESVVDETTSDDDAWTTDDEYHSGLDDSFDDLEDLNGANDATLADSEVASSAVDLDAELESLEDFDVDSLEEDFEASFGDDLADIDSELAGENVVEATGVTGEDAAHADADLQPETSGSDDIFEAEESSGEFEAFESEISALNKSFGETEISSASQQSLESSDDENDENADLALIDGAEELSTKLDLARAFIDMDDVEGALELLDEVISDATDESLIAEAKQLKDSL